MKELSNKFKDIYFCKDESKNLQEKLDCHAKILDLGKKIPQEYKYKKELRKALLSSKNKLENQINSINQKENLDITLESQELQAWEQFEEVKLNRNEVDLVNTTTNFFMGVSQILVLALIIFFIYYLKTGKFSKSKDIFYLKQLGLIELADLLEKELHNDRVKNKLSGWFKYGDPSEYIDISEKDQKRLKNYNYLKNSSKYSDIIKNVYEYSNQENVSSEELKEKIEDLREVFLLKD